MVSFLCFRAKVGEVQLDHTDANPPHAATEARCVMNGINLFLIGYRSGWGWIMRSDQLNGSSRPHQLTWRLAAFVLLTNL